MTSRISGISRKLELVLSQHPHRTTQKLKKLKTGKAVAVSKWNNRMSQSGFY